MKEKEIKKLSDEEVDKLFTDLIRETMTDEDFEKWAMTWLDSEEICDQAEEWNIESKKGILIEYQDMI